MTRITLERTEWLRREPDEKRWKMLKIITWILTGVVLILVGLMRRPELRIPLPDGVDLTFLPGVYSAINGIVAVVLIAALVAIFKGKIELHKKLMTTAMGLSVLFLLGYVAYHFTNVETLFGDMNGDGQLSSLELSEIGNLRTIYLCVLITHIVAAGVSLPLILLTFSAAWSNQFDTHRRFARWVFPIWLYVAATGPVCYLMLRPYY